MYAKTDHRYEVLRPHAHHSANTSYIVRGEMTIWSAKDGTLFGAFGAGDWTPITAIPATGLRWERAVAYLSKATRISARPVRRDSGCGA